MPFCFAWLITSVEVMPQSKVIIKSQLLSELSFSIAVKFGPYPSFILLGI